MKVSDQEIWADAKSATKYRTYFNERIGPTVHRTSNGNGTTVIVDKEMRSSSTC